MQPARGAAHRSATGGASSRLAWPVVHTQANHAHRPRDQRLRLGSLGAIARHVLHAAVPAPGEPLLQMLVVFVELEIRDSDLLKAEFMTELFDVGSESLEFCRA